MASQRDNRQTVSAPAPLAFVHSVTAYSVSSEWVKGSSGLRFDATHYNPRLANAITMLRGSGMELVALGKLTERVFIPSRFKRIYVEREHGVPFLQGSHLVHFDPADIKYVSLKAHARTMQSLLIQEGWVLITRSGTIGRVAVAPKQWDGWAASEHIMRIVPRNGGENAPPGYLAAFLRSFPGQAQLTSSIYGAVVDEITEEQTRAVLIPVAKTPAQRRAVQQIDATVMEAVRRQGEAVKLIGESLEAVARLIGD